MLGSAVCLAEPARTEVHVYKLVILLILTFENAGLRFDGLWPPSQE